MHDRNKCHDFWKAQSADTKGMKLNKDVSEFDKTEKLEILSYLPDINNKDVLELGAGIGLFTGNFASSANKVVAIDFIDEFIKKNKETHSNYSNITFITQNVMNLNFEVETFDFIFMNWLLMYLSDHETKVFSERIQKWLKPNGQFFLRESCNCASIPDKPMPHTNYRKPSFYSNLFQRLSISSHGNIKFYETIYGNPNQIWWLFNKF